MERCSEQDTYDSRTAVAQNRWGPKPDADGAPSRYRYPVPSPAVNDPDHEGWPAVAE